MHKLHIQPAGNNVSGPSVYTEVNVAVVKEVDPNQQWTDLQASIACASKAWYDNIIIILHRKPPLLSRNY